MFIDDYETRSGGIDREVVVRYFRTTTQQTISQYKKFFLFFPLAVSFFCFIFACRSDNNMRIAKELAPHNALAQRMIYKISKHV